MQGPSIEEQVGAVGIDEEIKDIPLDEKPDPGPGINGGELLRKVLTTPTGPGPVSDYLDHPLNFNRSEGMARIIRGMTGYAGNLNLAIIDISAGLLELIKGRKKVTVNEA